jgi:hypothetical protein
MTPPGCARHRWSPWADGPRGLVERRCACGSVERATPEAAAERDLAPLLAELRALGCVVTVTITRKEAPA